MKLPFSNQPIVVINSIDSVLAVELVRNLSTQQTYVVSTQQIPKNDSFKSFSPYLLHLPADELLQLNLSNVYSVIFDPYIFHVSKSLKKHQDLTQLIRISAKSSRLLYLTPSSVVHQKNQIPEWLENSEFLLTELASQFEKMTEQKIVFIKDSFDLNLNSHLSPISHLLSDISETQKIVMNYQGEEIVSPLFTPDMVSIIPKLLFGHNISDTFIEIESFTSQISLNFILELQSIFQKKFNLHLDRIQSQEKNILYRDTSEFRKIFPPTQHALEESVTKIFSQPKKLPDLQASYQEKPQQPDLSQTSAPLIVRKKSSKKSRRKYISKYIIFVLFLVIVGVSIAVSPFMILYGLNHYFSNGSQENSNLLSHQQQAKLNNWAKSNALRLTAASSVSDTRPDNSKINSWVVSTAFLNSIHINTNQIESKLIKAHNQVFSGSESWVAGLSSSISAAARKLQSQVSVHQLRSNSGGEESDYLAGISSKSLALSLLSEIYPSFINASGSSQILLLILDDSELRPTGGFISSVGLLSFNQGRLIDVEIQPVHQLDDLLNGQVDPPADLKQVMNQSSWLLRDSNWDSDFEVSAKKAAWFYQKQTNHQVDGVVAITTTALQDLLGEMEFDLAEYGKVNQTNLKHKVFEQASSQADVSSDVDLLTVISRSILDYLDTLKPSQIISLYQSIYENLSDQDILLYSKNPVSQSAIVKLGFAGSVVPSSCPHYQQNCFTETFFTNEANIGIDQVNLFINRLHQHQAEILSKVISHTHTTTITNSSPSPNHPAGTYQAYIRIYLPSNSEFIKLTLDGSSISSEKIISSSSSHYQIIGTIVNVGVGESVPISIQYQTPHQFNLVESSIYQLEFKHQPGAGADPLQLKIVPPQSVDSFTTSWGQEHGDVAETSIILDSTKVFQVAFP